MKSNFLFAAVFLFLLTSCGNADLPDRVQESETRDSTSLTNEQEDAKNYPEEIQSLLASFPEKKDFPLVLDSTLIRKAEQGDSLPGKDVRFLSSRYHPHELFDFQNYTLKNYFEIDSLKTAGAYAEYVEQLDIGMTKNANAHRLFYVSLNENSLLFFWEIDYHTYEACPYGSGIYLFMTHAFNGEIQETLCVALEDGGSDPPVAGGTNRYAVIDQSGTITINQQDVSDEDMDQPKVEVRKSFYRFAIKDAAVLLEKEELSSPEMVKRETVGY